MIASSPQARELKYRPRKQFLPLHQRDKRWACVVAHRRAGKTVACVVELIIRALYSPKHNPRYAYVAPFYSQAKQVAWEYLKEYALPFIDSMKSIRESELSVQLVNGARIRLYGADNPDALRGIYLDGVVLDEYGDCRPSLWGEVLLPTLSDREGWAIFIGTPKGKNHFYEINQRSQVDPDWYAMTLKASESQILSAETIRQIKQQQTESEHLQEYECDFTAAVKGTIYADIIQAMEQDLKISPEGPNHNPDLPTYAATDLGFTDSTAFWFWQNDPTPKLIDYYEKDHKPLVHYMDYLDSLPYNIERIWLPHDARAKTLQTGRSTVEQFVSPIQETEHGAPIKRLPYPVAIAPNIKRQHGIDAVRLVLPHTRINQRKCFAGIEALRAYRRKYDETLKQYSPNPLHDWASNGSDAFRYFALVVRDLLPDADVPAPQPERPHWEPPKITLDGLFEDRLSAAPRYQFERQRIA